jgi:hypothetical protein
MFSKWNCCKKEVPVDEACVCYIAGCCNDHDNCQELICAQACELSLIQFHHIVGFISFSERSKLPWMCFHGVFSAIWLRFHCFVVCTPSNSTMFDSGNGLLKSSLVQSAEQQVRGTQECSCVEPRAALQKLPNNWYCSLWL